MTTPTLITQCFTCGKIKGRVKCEGCSKIYCVKHFEDHRQQLSKQLDEVEVTRDLFRQSLTEKTGDSQNNSSIQQIDEWENESMNKIRQAASEARQILLKHTTETFTKMEEKLNKLTNQLRQSRQENDFFETDLNQWRAEITQMQKKLIKPSDVMIQPGPTPLITKLNVQISGEIFKI
jgi:vacuolar-type H+-ATPase subunit H